MAGLFELGALGAALNATGENPVIAEKSNQIVDPKDNRIIQNKEALSHGGVTVTLPGVNFDFQIYSMHVSKANERIDFDFLTKVTNNRVIGFFMTSNEVIENELLSNLRHGTIQLNVDNEDIIPAGASAALFTASNNLSFYDNMYVMNEKANASQVKGTYTSGPVSTWHGEYDVTIYLYNTKK